eukprot:NODE_74_length_23402_cov_1.166974.p9 type:complete len:114 gc:universal NODE_74_length_23402_cov_1.166974:21133-20792(-)
MKLILFLSPFILGQTNESLPTELAKALEGSGNLDSATPTQAPSPIATAVETTSDAPLAASDAANATNTTNTTNTTNADAQPRNRNPGTITSGSSTSALFKTILIASVYISLMM